MKNNREKILEAAVTVFSKKGFHQAGMEEIAQRAGVGKGTIYLHFDNKAMLFAAAVSEGQSRIMDTIKRELESGLPFPEHFKLLIERNVSLNLKNGDLSKILFNELSSGIEPEALREIRAARERHIVFLADILERGCALGYIKPVDFRAAAVGILGLMDGLCNHHFRSRGILKRITIVETMHTLLSSGLLVGK
jgi:AcrR family transcriptional regulator